MKGKLLKIIGAVAIINILARLLGFAREVVIGYQYGTTSFADSIITAYTIPNFLYIVVGGAITTAFISVYSKVQADGRREQFMSSTFTYITSLVGIMTILLLIFAEPILSLLFGGMDNDQMELTKRLYYWMAPSTFFLVFSMWLSGILNVHEKFHLSTFSTFVYNLGFVVIAVALTPLMGVDSYGFGALASAVLMVIMLLIGLKKGSLPSFKIQFQFSPELKRLLIIALPIMLGGAALQFYALIQRIFAAHLSDAGYIAALNYASKLTQFPQAILMTAVTTVIYPLLTKKVAGNEQHEITTLYQKGLNLLGLLLIPVTIFVFFYAKEMITIIFEYGNFTKQSSDMTVPLLQIFSISMFAMAANVYVTRFFYAMENSYMPVLVSILCVFGINIAVVYWLIDSMGAEAIAWGTTISSIANLILLQILAKNVLKLSILTSSIAIFGKNVLFYAFITGMMFVSSHYLVLENAWLDILIGGMVFIIMMFVGMKVLKLRDLTDLLKRKKAGSN